MYITESDRPNEYCEKQKERKHLKLGNWSIQITKEEKEETKKKLVGFGGWKLTVDNTNIKTETVKLKKFGLLSRHSIRINKVALDKNEEVKQKKKGKQLGNNPAWQFWNNLTTSSSDQTSKPKRPKRKPNSNRVLIRQG